ncbi:MAM and LDL-receptor class A domain-containing protein 1-like [Antedon mediterranea]|uniref:MAM and LDL-receptor class A domain-containing protein 1-like n=1 Tax=Antedon mediterranea TaxID=105859 RepID=UPI003AF70937
MSTYTVLFLLILSVLMSELTVNCEIDCSFEEDICTITKDKTASAQWNRQSDQHHNDHTYGNSSGFFMSVHGNGPARLLIHVVDGGPRCLTFWYKLYNPNKNAQGGILRVYQTYNSAYFDEPIWEVTGNLGKVWRSIELDLSSSTDFKIVIEGERHPDSYVLLDDVAITDERCSGTHSVMPDISCDFEYNLCGYQTNTNVDVDWIRQQADDGMSGDGPDEDHTFGFDYGHYLCVDPDNTPRYEGHRARITSPIQNITEEEYCVLFWYYISGVSVGELKVFSEKNNKKELMWNVRGDQRSSWHRGSFQLTNTNDPFRLIFEAIRGSNPSQGAFCVDDVDVLSGICSIHNTSPTPTDTPWQVKNIEDAGCTFETNECGYGSYDEKETSLGVKSGYDHTVGANGHFVGLKYSKAGWTYRTPYIFSNSVSNCLTFYYKCTYHYCKYGGLNIYIIDQADGKNALPVDPFQIVKTYSTKWEKIKIDLPLTNDNFTVVFETEYKGNVYGIDDVEFYNHECSEEVKPTKEPFKSTIDCDFEEGEICGYSQGTGMYSRNKAWTRIQGPTHSLNTGPDNDHTLNTTEGHYIYVEASGISRQTSFLISTPLFKHVHGPMCLRFWYHMKGEHIDRLNVRKDMTYQGTIWSTSSTTSGWKLQNIEIDNIDLYDKQIKIYFEAYISGGHKGDVALDDITLVDNVCNPPKPAITYSYCQFNSYPNKCNYNDYRPNNKWHSWKHQSKINVSSVNSFLYADKTIDKYVAIESPKFEYAKLYCLQMSYIIKQDFGLNANFGYESIKPVMTSLRRQMAPSWAKYSLEFKPIQPDEQFTIIFEAGIGNDRNGFVAIDNIMINKGHCPVPGVVDKIDCNFEMDCGFFTNISLANGWQLSNKDTYKHKKLPNIDNTYGSPSGHYYFISFRHTQPQAERNFLRTPVVEMIKTKKCLHFYYYMNSNAVSSLNIYVDDESVKHFPVDPIWSYVGKKGNRWNLVQIDIGHTKGNYSIVFEPRSGGEHHADIAIDDVFLLDKSCSKATELNIDCDFESGSCGYTNMHTAKFSWTRNGGRTETTSTGPIQDHTHMNEDNKGNYMYIETSPPRIPLDAAELSSPLLPPSTKSKCLHFWYHMNGKSVGSLEVYRVMPILSEKTLLWSKHGEQGDHWRKAIVPLNVKRYFKNGSKEILDHSLKVHFRGIVGFGYEGDIAIDDVKVVTMSCDPHPKSPPVTETSCDFENGVEQCGFKENTEMNGSGKYDGNIVNWTFFNASLIVGNQPNDIYVSLSQNQSSYIFTKAETLTIGQRVGLASPDISAGWHYCLHYSYVSTGDFVIAIYTNSSGKVKVIDALSRRHQSTWSKHTVNILPQEKTFTVLFEGVVGRERTGIMALDDILIKNGKCAKGPQLQKTTELPEANELSSHSTAIACLSALFATAMLLLVLFLVYHWKMLNQPKSSGDTNQENELIEVDQADIHTLTAVQT